MRSCWTVFPSLHQFLSWQVGWRPTINLVHRTNPRRPSQRKRGISNCGWLLCGFSLFHFKNQSQNQLESIDDRSWSNPYCWPNYRPSTWFCRMQYCCQCGGLVCCCRIPIWSGWNFKRRSDRSSCLCDVQQNANHQILKPSGRSFYTNTMNVSKSWERNGQCLNKCSTYRHQRNATDTWCLP